MLNLSSRRSRAVIGLAAVLTLLAGAAEARAGRGGSFGSRGSRTYDAPPVTRTAPNQASPIERSQIPNSGPALQRPGVPPAQAAQPGRFGTGFMAGLLGAGTLGLLFGSGFFGGLAGLGSIIGFVLQLGLVGLLVFVAVRWFRKRQQPALAGGPGLARTAAEPHAGERAGASSSGPMSALGGALGGSSRPPRAARERKGAGDEIGVGPPDFDAFERALTDVQSAYSRGDVAALWSLATPEMAGYLQEQLNDDARNGVLSTLSDVRLLQGDLAESWREGEAEYATVAMRFSGVEVTVEKTTGRVVEGDRDRPVETTELWTFRRDRGAVWTLAAIQQA